MSSTRAIPDQHTCWIEHRRATSEVASDPLHGSVFLYESPLGIEVVGIERPILDAGVSHACPLSHIDLHTASME